MAEVKCLAVCLDCGSLTDGDDQLVVPFHSHDERDEWARAHCGATDHSVVGIDGWPSPAEVRAALTSYP